jgi:undecaprenyl pyrophosphate synthase
LKRGAYQKPKAKMTKHRKRIKKMREWSLEKEIKELGELQHSIQESVKREQEEVKQCQ